MTFESADDDNADGESNRIEELEAEIATLQERLEKATQEAVNARNDDEIAELKDEISSLQREKNRLESDVSILTEELQSDGWLWTLLALVVFVFALLGIGSQNDDDGGSFGRTF